MSCGFLNLGRLRTHRLVLAPVKWLACAFGGDMVGDIWLEGKPRIHWRVVFLVPGFFWVKGDPRIFRSFPNHERKQPEVPPCG